MKTLYFPHRPSKGGPSTFQRHFINYLQKKGVIILYGELPHIANIRKTMVFLIGGSTNLFQLFILKLLNAKIILRLDGITYRHTKVKFQLMYFLRAEYSNFFGNYIRTKIADLIIYQSEYVKKWWEGKYGVQKSDSVVIYNGAIIPDKKEKPYIERGTIELICIEGVIPPDPYVLNLLKSFENLAINGKDVIIRIFGDVIEGFDSLFKDARNIHFFHYVDNNTLLKYIDISDIFLSLEVNAACPNSVIEAMSNQLPIIGFDTGSMSELVPHNCGILVPFEGDPYSLVHKGDHSEFIKAVELIMEDSNNYSYNSYYHAKENFNINLILSKYYQKLDGLLEAR